MGELQVYFEQSRAIPFKIYLIVSTIGVAICLIIVPTSVIVPSGFKKDILAIANAGIFKLIFLSQKLFYF